MIELLSGIRKATLDSRKLRSIAFELVGGEPSGQNLTDQEVLAKFCLVYKIDRTIGEGIETLVEEICTSLDLPFDPSRDIEPHRLNSFGMTEFFWRKIVSALKGEPWVFICNYAENEASAVHNDVFGITYGFHEKVTTWRGLVASGPGTFIIFYNTSNAPHSKMSYSSFARIESIEESRELDEEGRRNWTAKLSDFHTITPVPMSQIEIDGRNQQHGIQAVTFHTFQKILELGNGGNYLDNSEEKEDRNPSALEGSVDLLDVLKHGPLLVDLSFNSKIDAPREIDESMSERDFTADRAISSSRKNTRALDKRTETQAVEIVLAYLTRQGWNLVHDNQLDGVGYDFEFSKNGESLLIEIKGIRGSRLDFNMTAREFYVCRTKSNFRLIAVTNALNVDAYRIHVLSPSDIYQMRRRITQYRLSSSTAIGSGN